MTLTLKNKFYLHIAISILVLGCLAFGSSVVFGMVKTESGKLTSQKVELIQIQEKRTKIFEASQEYERIKESIEKLNSSILLENEELKFIVFIESISKQNRVNYDLNISNTTDSNIVFQVNAAGAFNDMLSFIKQIENSPYYANIENISMTKAKSSVGGAEFKGKLNYPLGPNDVKTSLIIKVYMHAEK